VRARAESILSALAAPLAALAAIGLAAALTWADLQPAERTALAAVLTAPRLGLAALLVAAGLTVLGIHLHRRESSWRQASRRIAGGARLMASGNSAHRLLVEGDSDLQELADSVNALAAERSRLLDDVQTSIAQAKSRVEEEKNRLAALVSELDQSVLVCNRDGRILLYNAAVSALFAGIDTPKRTHLLGLGRSVFAIVDRSLILHAIESIHDRGNRGEHRSAHFVTATSDGRLLRVQLAPVFGSGTPADGPDQRWGSSSDDMTGFVLLLADVTENVDSDARSAALFQDLVEATRSAVASIRTAVENLIAHPDLDIDRRTRFTSIVQAEAVRLSDRLDLLSVDFSERLRQRWPLEEMRGVDLLSLARRRIERRRGLLTRLESVDSDLWLRVDSFTLAQALSSLAGRLHDEFAVRDLRFSLRSGGTHAQLDVAWQGVPLSSETAFTWQNDAFTLGGEDSPLSLAQVMERHGGEAWFQRDVPSQTNYFRLLLPLASEQAASRARRLMPNRPEFYDFDLFGRSSVTEAFDARPLAELTYTVFDTETTGLDPAHGDEIIAIGATRIVNGRLLQAEIFESLIDPGRNVSQESIDVHGITPEKLLGQPRIGEILPQFWRFAEDTVLVGHNAAFDMRFLQLKEAQTGLRFEQPVLDTLLLSAIAHPSEQSHALEAVAARLGIEVIGRHTALGDALTTAHVLLRLIPMLAERGIHTLGQARVASEKTFYARLKY